MGTADGGRRGFWPRAGAVVMFVLRGLASLYFAEVWMWTAPRPPDPDGSQTIVIPRPRASSDALR